MYRCFFKRFLDFTLSLCALLVLWPVLLVLALVGAVKMEEKIFKLIKFRTMNMKTDETGTLLPDHLRLTRYGRILRSTSLDELPELINILKGDMSIIGPRPLLVRYLSRYNEEQRHRHDVRPGLTGYAQVNGRNAISWEERFKLDVEYVRNITFWGDVKILFQTVAAVFKREGISSETAATMEEFMGTEEKAGV